MLHNVFPSIENPQNYDVNQLKTNISNLLDEINSYLTNFLNQDLSQVMKGIKEKLLYIADIYSTSPDEFPQLGESWHQHFLRLSKIIDDVYQNNNKANIDMLNDDISQYNLIITEQYINIAIEGLYHAIVAGNLPSLPLVEAEEKLPYSMKVLGEIFEKIITDPADLASIKTVLKKIEKEKNLPLKTSTYFILLAQLLHSIQDINVLDDTSGKNIFGTLTNLLKTLKENSLIFSELFSELDFSSNPKKRLIVHQEESPLKKQKINPFTLINNDVITWNKADGILLTLFADCYTKNIPGAFLSDLIYSVLLKIHPLYLSSPQDFPGLLETLLQDANTLKNKCNEHFSQKSVDLLEISIEEELKTFYQQMTSCHVQMQIFDLYNNNCGNNLITQTNNDIDWKDAFSSIMLSLANFKAKTLDPKLQDKVKDLEDQFSTINSILLLNEEMIPAIIPARQCIIALHHLLKTSTEIWDLDPKFVEGVIDTINKMRENLADLLENSLSGNNIDFKRMKFAQAENTPVLSLKETSIAYKLFNAVYSEKKFSTPFSFFLEKNSTKELRAVAKSYEMACRDVPGDGECFFAAVALWLKLKKLHPTYSQLPLPEAAGKLRKLANDYIETHPNEFQDFLIEENLQKFINRMKQSAEWADHHHHIALCRTLNIILVVINSDRSQPIVTKIRDADPVICLGYEVNLHYQVLVPLDHSKQLPHAIMDLVNKVDCINNTPTSAYVSKI